jgi:putative DNA methylase
VLEKVRAEIGDLYPLVPDPECFAARERKEHKEKDLFDQESLRSLRSLAAKESPPPGYLMPVAYLWTRTVKCKNPTCGATVPLVKQTWLCKKEGRYVAIKVVAPKHEMTIRFEVVEAKTAAGLGFDPEAFSRAGNATCPFCGTVADSNYVKQEGCSQRIGQELMAIAATRVGRKGKTYLSASEHPALVPDNEAVRDRISTTCGRSGLLPPTEAVEANPRSMDTQHFGLKTWADHFTPRQLLSLLSFVEVIRRAESEMIRCGVDGSHSEALTMLLACVLDKQVDFNSSLCVLKPDGGRGIVHTFGRQALTMVWDFAEANPLNEDIACWQGCLAEVVGNTGRTFA